MKIILEIGEKKFSVQMDGTQDTATLEQETIILRYVLGLEVKECLFSVQKVYDASAAGIFQPLKTNIEQQGLKMEYIIDESFDGASNMRRKFAGVQKLIRDVSPNSVYRWCYAHVLNLCCYRYGRKHTGSEKFDRLISMHRNAFFRFMQTNGCLEQDNG